MTIRTTLLTLGLTLGLTTVGCGKSDDKGSGEGKASSVTIDALGVSVALPAGFSHKEKRGEHWIVRGMTYGARLEKRDALPADLDAAIKSWMEGTVADKGTIDGGGFYAVIETEFPTADGAPMKLPFVYVQVPIKDASILCSGQLQQGDDPKPLIAACKGIKAL